MLGFSAISETPISSLPIAAAVALSLGDPPDVYVLGAQYLSYVLLTTPDLIARPAAVDIWARPTDPSLQSIA